MPPRTAEQVGFRPYSFHGLVLSEDGSGQGLAECPWCLKEKFAVHPETTEFRCWVCGRRGNNVEFVRLLHEKGMQETPADAYESLAENRGLEPETLAAWGVCRSPLTGDWMVPGFSHTGALVQLYRYVGREKRALYATPGLHHGLVYLPSSQEKGRAVVCEGVWDAMKLWETWGGHAEAGCPANVYAVPGANTWNPSWCNAVADKELALYFDNDDAGLGGMKHACGVMSQNSEYKPTKVDYLDWSKAKEPYPKGCDVRDVLKEHGRAGLKLLEELLAPTPADWSPGQLRGRVEIGSETCESWKELTDQWKKAMRWGPGLEGALACMLASVTSVRSGGEQLWLKVISPPSGGKTKLCEAVSANRTYVVAKSDMTAFYSGYREGKDDKTQYSLATRLFDKTLITKDADTLLTNPNKDVIFAQGRDLYDTTGRKEYGHGVSHELEGLRMTWILAGTPALREIDRSELGQRFLDWVIMDAIDEETERDICLRAMAAQERELRMESNCKADSLHDREYLKAMRMTAGYVQYLRRNWPSLVEKLRVPAGTADFCFAHANFVSFLRARPSSETHEDATRELSARLSRQMYKLARFLAVVTQRPSVDATVLAKVRKVALDTSRGRTMEIARVLDKSPQSGENVARLTGQKYKTEEDYLVFMRAIGAVEQFSPDGHRYRWRLTKRFKKVWKGVMNAAQS